MQQLSLDHDQLKLLADCVQQRLYPEQFVPEGRDSRDAMFELLDLLDGLRKKELEPICGPCATLEADGVESDGNLTEHDRCVSCEHMRDCDGWEDGQSLCDCGLSQ